MLKCAIIQLHAQPLCGPADTNVLLSIPIVGNFRFNELGKLFE